MIEDHDTTVERIGPQRYRADCSCGWRGLTRKGTDPWSQDGALAKCFNHQAEQGVELEMPHYVDNRRGSE